MCRSSLTILFASALSLFAAAGCTISPVLDTPTDKAAGDGGACTTPSAKDVLVLEKTDGNCETALYNQELRLGEETGCTVTQSAGTCNAVFSCKSTNPEGTTELAGNVVLTSTGAAAGNATVVLTNADGTPKCKGNYKAEITKR